jgi:drug/metabolite transporter (DMT)-like permease
VTVFYALLCAVLWGAMELLFLRLAKALGGLALLAWLALGGVVVALPLALLSGAPPGGSAALAAALGANVVNVVASGLYFVALERGRLAVISPVIATQAAVAVVLGVIVLDEDLSTLAALGCVGAAVGVVLAAAGSGKIAGGGATGIAAMSAVLYGVYVILLSETAAEAGTFWTVLTYRLAVAAVLVPWLLRDGRRLPRPPWKLLAGALALETAGFAAYIEAFARGPVAIAAPLAIQYSTIAVILAALVLHERLLVRQWVGVAVVIGSVSLVAAS